MRWLITAIGFGLLLALSIFSADEYSALARVTVYWHSKGSGANAAWKGVPLRYGHCAVDPKKIPYGSQIVFHDAECISRLCGRSAAEHNAIVIDRFFDTKEKSAGMGKANPHFMVVQVCTPGNGADSPKRLVSAFVRD